MELVSNNKAKVRRTDYVDSDKWARSDPPLRGVLFADRESAKASLTSGNLGAVLADGPQTPLLESVPNGFDDFSEVQMGASTHEDVEKGAIPAVSTRSGLTQSGTANGMPRVPSGGSRVSKVSSVPSFGKMREPLSGDSTRLTDDEGPNSHGRKIFRRAAAAEYEEFGSEALITHVYDLDDDDLEEGTPSVLFSDIGPSISMTHGIGRKLTDSGTSLPKVTDVPSASHPSQFSTDPPPVRVDEPDSDVLNDEAAVGATRGNYSGAPPAPPPLPPVPSSAQDEGIYKTEHPPPPPLGHRANVVEERGGAPLPLPPAPPAPSSTYEREGEYEASDTLNGPYPPPPPPPLYNVQSYGAAPHVPPPPSSPPPDSESVEHKIESLNLSEVQSRPDDTSPVTGEGADSGFDGVYAKASVHVTTSDYSKEMSEVESIEVESRESEEKQSLGSAEIGRRRAGRKYRGFRGVLA